MGRMNLKERIRQGLFLLDGAMGTQLFAAGIEVGVCNDYLNIESPDTVFNIHRAYFQAGSDAVLTNTFGANRYGLGRHNLEEKVEQINSAGAQIARRAAGEERYVLGDIGPAGDFFQPLGSLKPNECKEAFARQAEALCAGGVDGFIIETMTALDEMVIAIEAAKSVGGALPVFASMAFDKAGGEYRTMMGVDVESAVKQILSLGVDAAGFNCGTLSLEQYTELAVEFVSAVKALGSETVIYAEPNAGKPELVDGEVLYKVSAADFAAAAEKIHSGGVEIIGGCCGTSPAHIKALSDKLKK